MWEGGQSLHHQALHQPSSALTSGPDQLTRPPKEVEAHLAEEETKAQMVGDLLIGPTLVHREAVLYSDSKAHARGFSKVSRSQRYCCDLTRSHTYSLKKAWVSSNHSTCPQQASPGPAQITFIQGRPTLP